MNDYRNYQCARPTRMQRELSDRSSREFSDDQHSAFFLPEYHQPSGSSTPTTPPSSPPRSLKRALTFAAVYDPVQGLVGFSGDELKHTNTDVFDAPPAHTDRRASPSPSTRSSKHGSHPYSPESRHRTPPSARHRSTPDSHNGHGSPVQDTETREIFTAKLKRAEHEMRARRAEQMGKAGQRAAGMQRMDVDAREVLRGISMDISPGSGSSRHSGASTVMGLPRGAAAPGGGVAGEIMMSQDDIVMINQGENVSSFFSTTSTSTSNYVDVDFPNHKEEEYYPGPTASPSASPRRKLRKRQRPSDGSATSSSSYRGSSGVPTFCGSSQFTTPPTSPRQKNIPSPRTPLATPPTDVLARKNYNHTPTYVEGPSWMPPYQATPQSSPQSTPNPRAVPSPGENWSPGALSMTSPAAESPAEKTPYQHDPASPSRSIVNFARRMKGQKKEFESDDSDWVCVDIVHVPVVMQRVSDMV